MAFPGSPTNGQTTIVNGITYVYDATYQSWTRVPVDLDVATISNISSNIGAYQTYANANAATQATSINSIDANIGSYQTYANANAATQATSIDTFNANLGAYQTYANANAATQATSINTIDANLGTATTNITTLFGNAASQEISITSLATGANANTAAYLPSVTTLAGLTSFGTAAVTTIAQGNLTIVGNLTVQGNTLTIGSNNLTVTDSIIDLHTYANLAPLISNDGRDIGIRFHYYKTSDKHAFIGWENATEALTYYQDATETNGVITGTLGNVELGSLYVSNTATATSTTTGALQVRGGVGISGNVYAGKIYTTDGLYWAGNGNVIVTGGGGGTFTASNTTPSSASPSDFWYYVAGDILFQYINDGDSNQWVDTSSPVAPTSTVVSDLVLSNVSISSVYNVNSTLTALGLGTTANLTIGNVITGIVTATGNVNAANLTTTGNVVAGNLITGIVTAGGNITASNVVTGIVTASGNITAANITTSGNIQAAYVQGDGSKLTNTVTTGKAIAMAIVFGG